MADKIVHELKAQDFHLPEQPTRVKMTPAQYDSLLIELMRAFNGNRDQATIWLRSVHPLLGNRRPSECTFEEARREVDRLVNR